jgi:hypothetical protein
MAKNEAKGKIVPVRFTAAEYTRLASFAEKGDQTVSQWIRGTLHAAMQE